MKAAMKALMATGLFLLSIVTSVAQAEVARGQFSTVELVSEVSSVAKGQTFTIGLNVVPEEHWHNYWMNPGDAGKEMKVTWDLPEGIEVGSFSYQTPHIVSMAGIVTYGYSEPNTILANVTVPADFAGDSLTMSGKASWLVCDDKNCIPERGNISLTLPVGDGSLDDANAELFKTARQHSPKVVDWQAAFYEDENNLNFEVAFPVEGASDIYVWPARAKIINHSAEQNVVVKDGVLTMSVEKGSAKRIAKAEDSGILITYKAADGGEEAVFVEAAPKVEGSGTVTGAAASSGGDSDGGSSLAQMGFMAALGAAFLGGLILNLMPCVLPVLSLKMLSLAKMGEKHPSAVRSSGVYYTIGVVMSFVLMAAAVLIIKAAGSTVMWGFQMQNPAFLLFLIMLMVLIGLNLMGVFEFGTSMMNVGSNLASDEDSTSKKSSFWTGVLAVIVATPCTAPFMAGALGYALVQDWYVSLLIFVSLGLGLAFPYLMIAFVPNARKFVPNPGPWMSVFKESLAFPMFGTALWLLWVLVGASFVVLWSMTAVLLLAVAAWAWGKVAMSAKPNAWRVTAVVSFVVMLAFPVQWTLEAKADEAEARKAGQVAGGSHASETQYSEATLMETLQTANGVFAYFTADWCITCKANEKASLHTDAVQKYFEDNGIEVMVGDYTDYDDHITKVLQAYSHPGVPLYLYFEPGDGMADGKKLPQTLMTPDAIISQIESK